MNEFIKKNMEKLTKCIKPHKNFRTSSGIPCIVNNEHTLEQMLTHDYREEDSTQGYSKYSQSKNHNTIKEDEQSSTSINSGFRAKTSMKERKRENEGTHVKEIELKERRPNSSRKKL
jgi:lipid II:glycine glycyltransferase (peptidoglycan interpeptide bridge formation enzyme)